jgi:hypothetical protein
MNSVGGLGHRHLRGHLLRLPKIELCAARHELVFYSTEALKLTQSTQSGRPAGETVFGFPLRGFGFFTSLLLSLAAAFFTFFASTTLAIFALLAWNLVGHHAVSYANSYRYVGFPAFLLVLVVTLPVFGVLWARAKMQK